MADIAKGKRPHVLAVPFPAQGHVTPLMKLSRLIANHGIKVTFVNTQHIHDKILASIMLSDQEDTKDKEEDSMAITSIPDGLAPDDDRNDAFKLIESLRSTMAASLTHLIHKINCSNSDEKVSFIVADITVGWVLEVAERVGAEPVGFWPAAAATLAVTLHIPKLIEQGNFDGNGNISKFWKDRKNLFKGILWKSGEGSKWINLAFLEGKDKQEWRRNFQVQQTLLGNMVRGTHWKELESETSKISQDLREIQKTIQDYELKLIHVPMKIESLNQKVDEILKILLDLHKDFTDLKTKVVDLKNNQRENPKTSRSRQKWIRDALRRIPLLHQKGKAKEIPQRQEMNRFERSLAP
ncbi:UDP-glycosyltransferase 83A1 [Sesamum angolense]|uniref:UDP-glycosyltransferase 83A1 n=1 Tax=Sesamum angolense TaxID=2727404 RepID=A0AAE1WLX0_9LAMI|nr:UDP-glycosyltransferase 83A1 [Sesamum angolense]